MALESFMIIPILGYKSSVPQNDPSLLQAIGQGVAYTCDVGGINYDLSRKRNACTKSSGYSKLNETPTTQGSKCLGLFELKSGATYDYIVINNGKFYVIDSNFGMTAINDAGTTTFANDDTDLYSIIQVGDYVVFTDKGEHTAYKWKHGDTTISKLISAGTEYKFRYLESLQRRVVGVYSDQDNGDIDVRWSSDWPTTDITSMTFSAGNQLYIPNDDSITGIARMGRDRCFIYSENSVHTFLYSADYEVPFSLGNVVDGQGAVGHNSIVNTGDRHYLFNKNYGFVEFRGNEFPYAVISNDIEIDLNSISSSSYGAMVGTFVPLTREVCWALPIDGSGVPNYLYFYNIETRQWRRENRPMRYVSTWNTYMNYTWEDLATDLGGSTSLWSAAGNNYWSEYIAQKARLVYSYQNGYVYTTNGETLDGNAIDGYRIEPILDFGSPEAFKLLEEIWVDSGVSGDFSLHFWHRSGNTVGEVMAQSWTSLESVSLNSPSIPIIRCGKNARLHQIKWGTDAGAEKFEINKIIFKYVTQAVY